jgi:hypothetical protein
MKLRGTMKILGETVQSDGRKEAAYTRGYTHAQSGADYQPNPEPDLKSSYDAGYQAGRIASQRPEEHERGVSDALQGAQARPKQDPDLAAAYQEGYEEGLKRSVCVPSPNTCSQPDSLGKDWAEKAKETVVGGAVKTIVAKDLQGVGVPVPGGGPLVVAKVVSSMECDNAYPPTPPVRRCGGGSAAIAIKPAPSGAAWRKLWLMASNTIKRTRAATPRYTITDAILSPALINANLHRRTTRQMRAALHRRLERNRLVPMKAGLVRLLRMAVEVSRRHLARARSIPIKADPARRHLPILRKTQRIPLGTGTVTVDVMGDRMPTILEGHSFNTTVNVGSDHLYGGYNKLDRIYEPLTITNQPSFTHVTVNDSADSAPHNNVRLTATSLTGLAAAPINFGSNDLANLTITGGSGLTSTPSSTPSTRACPSAISPRSTRALSRTR